MGRTLATDIAYYAGCDAYLEEKQLNSNPYAKDVQRKLYLSWEAGWVETATIMEEKEE